MTSGAEEYDPAIVDDLFDRYLILTMEGALDARERALGEAADEASRRELERRIELDRKLLADLPDVLEEEDHLGPYRILEEIARGGQGIIFRAEHPSMGSDVALKVLPPQRSRSREHRRRLEEESQVLAGLSHPSIISAIEWLETPRGVCLVMVYLPIPSLARIGAEARARNQLPERRLAEFVGAGEGGNEPRGMLLARIFERLAHALDAAHRVGVLHGDLKPSNILIDGDGHPYLIDFGLATLVRPQSGAEGVEIHGTLPYTAPEVIDGGSAALSGAADLFGLGATLYECLSGQPVHSDEDFLALLQRCRSAPVTRVRRIDAGIPIALEAILARVLEREPDQRYRGAREFAADLGRFRRGEPPLAPCPRSIDTLRLHLTYQAWRHRAWGAALAVILLAALGTWWLIPPPPLERARRALQSGDLENARENLILAEEEGEPLESLAKYLDPFREEALRALDLGLAGEAGEWRRILAAAGAAPADLEILGIRSQGRWVLQVPPQWRDARVYRSDYLGRRGSLQVALDAARTRYALEPDYYLVVYPRSAERYPQVLLELRGREPVLGGVAQVPPLWPFEDYAAPKAISFEGGAYIRGHHEERWKSDPAYTDEPRGFVEHAFALESLEVSRGRYQHFLDCLQRFPGGEHGPFCHPDEPPGSHAMKVRGDLPSERDRPRTSLSFFDAWAFAGWAYSRLPSEGEFERAVRGGTQRWYSIGVDGEHLPPCRAVPSIGQVSRVDADPFCPGGLLHVHDSVWEFTASAFEPYPGSLAPRPDHLQIVVRGGYLGERLPPWNAPRPPGSLTPAWFRQGVDPTRSRLRALGCRLARSLRQ